jgi:hypothetical protein
MAGPEAAWAFAVFAELLLAVYTLEARPTSLTAARYREPPWRPFIETAGAVLARGRDRGEAVEQVVAKIWAAIEQAEVDTASDASAEVSPALLVHENRTRDRTAE